MFTIFWGHSSLCRTLDHASRKHLLRNFPMSSLAHLFSAVFAVEEFCFSWTMPKHTPHPPPPPPPAPPPTPQKHDDLPLILLTILAEVIHNNNSTQQIRWCSVDDTVYSAKEDRQPLLVEADYDSGSWQLGWICVMFAFTTVWIRFIMSKETLMRHIVQFQKISIIIHRRDQDLLKSRGWGCGGLYIHTYITFISPPI